MIKFELFDRARCTREEKSLALSSVWLILSLAERARREGLLVLEEEIEGIDGIFIKKLLRMVVDACEPELVRSFGETMIASSNLSGKELLDAIVLLEGVLLIQEGRKPHIVGQMLSAYLGADADLLDYERQLQIDFDSDSVFSESTTEPLNRDATIESIKADMREKRRLSGEQIDSLRRVVIEGNPFESMSADMVAIAILYLDEPSRKVAFDSLSPEKQTDVIKSICDLSGFDADNYIDLARKSLQNIIEAADSNYQPAGGVMAATALLRMAARKVESSVMQALEAETPELAAQVKKQMFVFEDVLSLDNRSIQKVLQEVDSQDLTRALKGASEEVLKKFYRNVSSRAAQALEEDLLYMGPVRISDVKEAREKIIAIIRHLNDTGEIIMNRPDDDLVE